MVVDLNFSTIFFLIEHGLEVAVEWLLEWLIDLKTAGKRI